MERIKLVQNWSWRPMTWNLTICEWKRTPTPLQDRAQDERRGDRQLQSAVRMLVTLPPTERNARHPQLHDPSAVFAEASQAFFPLWLMSAQLAHISSRFIPPPHPPSLGQISKVSPLPSIPWITSLSINIQLTQLDCYIRHLRTYCYFWFIF